MYYPPCLIDTEKLPVLHPEDLVQTDILVMVPRWYSWYQIWMTQIQNYQGRKYKCNKPVLIPSKYISIREPTHTQMYMGGGKIFEVTSPKSQITDIYHEKKYRYFVTTYADYPMDKITPVEMISFWEVANRLHGTKYDYGQLIDILIKQIFGFVPETLSIFDFSRKRKVCSVANHAQYIKWYLQWGWYNSGIRRPLGKQYMEVTCPTDLLVDPTFRIKGELKF